MGFQCVFFSVLFTLLVVFVFVVVLCDVNDLLSLFLDGRKNFLCLVKHLRGVVGWKKLKK